MENYNITFKDLDTNDKFIEDRHDDFAGVTLKRKVSKYEAVDEKYGTMGIVPLDMPVLRATARVLKWLSRQNPTSGV